MQSEGSSYKVTIFKNSEKPTGLHPLLSGIGNERVNASGVRFGQAGRFMEGITSRLVEVGDV